MTTTDVRRTSRTGAPRYVVVSAWAVPPMVVGGFSMIAVLPVALIAIGIARHARLARLRWPAALLTVAYGTPLAIYLLRDDPAKSLSDDMHPAFIPAIVAAVAMLLVAMYRSTTQHTGTMSGCAPPQSGGDPGSEDPAISPS